ncbi:MAG: hypothetical protein JWN02_2757 [Acidobacteria bacterium]|nr:hypothetical protein [Acidobacteriota bacterium]
MQRKTIATWTLAAALATTAGTLTAVAKESGNEEKVSYTSSIQVTGHPSQADLRKLARIGREDAIRAAQGAFAGKVGETKLENEEKNLVYTVEMSNGKERKEVIIDAGNGKVLTVDADNEKGDHQGSDPDGEEND